MLALSFALGYTLNRTALRLFVERTGYVTSVDLLQTELAWLAEMGYVELLELDAVRLTARGEDVSLGRIQVPGVRRPLPGEVRT